jgi:chromosomal replication initiator protein
LISEIQEAVADYYSLTVRDLVGRGRTRQLCAPRHLAIFLARERTTASLPELGRAFRRDHTSVLHAVRKLRADLAHDPCAVVALEFLRRRLDEQQSREETLLLQLPVVQQASGR